jgi:hypothetical protein
MGQETYPSRECMLYLFIKYFAPSIARSCMTPESHADLVTRSGSRHTHGCYGDMPEFGAQLRQRAFADARETSDEHLCGVPNRG